MSESGQPPIAKCDCETLDRILAREDELAKLLEMRPRTEAERFEKELLRLARIGIEARGVLQKIERDCLHTSRHKVDLGNGITQAFADGWRAGAMGCIGSMRGHLEAWDFYRKGPWA